MPYLQHVCEGCWRHGLPPKVLKQVLASARNGELEEAMQQVWPVDPQYGALVGAASMALQWRRAYSCFKFEVECQAWDT